MKENSKIKIKSEIRKLNKVYDMEYRGGVGRGLIDEEFIEILATYFIKILTNSKQ